MVAPELKEGNPEITYLSWDILWKVNQKLNNPLRDILARRYRKAQYKTTERGVKREWSAVLQARVSDTVREETFENFPFVPSEPPISDRSTANFLPYSI